MKNHRLLLLAVATASLVLLTGFKKTSIDTHPSTEKKWASAEVKKVQNSKQKKNKHSVLHVNNDVEPQKPLDLSIPFKDTWLKVEQSKAAQVETSTIFATEKKKPRRIDLDGQMIMSQEPETDKRKSVDGAAIVINLKR